MQLAGELAPLGIAHRQTEFVLIPKTTTRIFGACGPDALAACASAALQRVITTEQVYVAMRALGMCDVQGITTDAALARFAALPVARGGLGLAILEHRPFALPWAAWPNFLGWHLGSNAHPTLLEVDNGQALRDELTGLGENATGLRDHFIMLLKRHNGGYSALARRVLPAGYWACDGDSYAGGNDRAHNFAAADVLQFYSDATLASARPAAAIAFARVSGGGNSMPWHIVSPGVVADANGKQARYAMAAVIEKDLALGNVVAGCPGETYIDGGETSILPLEGDVSLVYTKASGSAHTDQTGAVLWRLFQQLSATQKELETVKANPPTPPAPPADPNAAKALALYDAVRAAVA